MTSHIIPVLHVSEAAAARRFYERLGFRLELTDRPGDAPQDPAYLGLARDGARLHLSSHAGDGVAGGVAYVQVDDVDAVHASLEREGIAIHLPPVDQSWGMRECYVRDPDGNTLRFGSPVAARGGGSGSGASPADAAAAAVDVGGITPILRVEDYDRSVAYYVDVLGFTLGWSDGAFGSVSRGHASIMLSKGSQGCAATWVYIGVSDADALHEELRGRGARIRVEPTNYPWGARELHVLDPDGHVLRFGSEAVPGEPMGEWLDEQRVRWRPRPDGGWERVG